MEWRRGSMIKLMRFMKPYRMTLVLVLVLAFAQSFANLYLPTLIADIVDNGVVKGDIGYIWRTGGLMLLVTIGGTICAIVGAFFGARVATGLGKIIRGKIFNRVEQFSLHEFDMMSTASLITRTTNDTTQVQQVWVIILLMMVTAPIMMLVLNVSSIAILWFGSIRVNNGEMQVGAIFAFLQYAMQILFGLLMVSMMFIMLPRAAASADRINEVLAIAPEINDAPTVNDADTQRGFVEFQDVTFSYPGAEEPALSNISFSASPGEVTAIIGGTGAGKSTLVSLIPRFYDIDSGHILIDGVDVREMSQEHLRAKIGFVPQKAVLFSGTISENIRYGKEDASEEEVQHAADVAQATEFISDMQDGFASVIAQGGMNVSGGQKQRLSIARALVRKPEIYVFDDSFSALDFKTDARLRAALKKETLDATVLIVAQRVSTVMDADQIIVLDEGHIAGIGNHRTLMRTSEVYREIVTSQLSMEEIAEEIA